jgi:hypothetical protein
MVCSGIARNQVRKYGIAPGSGALLAVSLLANGGVILGDDYDCSSNWAAARETVDIEADHVFVEMGYWVHPGVVLAVDEYFGKPVSTYGGVWAFKKRPSGFEELKLRGRELAPVPRFDEVLLKCFGDHVKTISRLPTHHPFRAEL